MARVNGGADGSRSDSRSSWNVSFDFDNMSGVEFENFIRRLFQDKGFEVQGTPRTGDQGADLIARKNGKTHVIQAKRRRSVVGNRAVQEVLSAVAYYRADEGCVITNATFSRSAKALAQRSGWNSLTVQP